jgi:monoterpene epsilon-lactone hydrolase
VVMGDRPEVQTASLPIAALDLLGLGAQLGVAMARVPFRDPLGGSGTVAHRLGATVTREALRSFMGYSTGLRVQEFRSIELALDRICKVALRPPVAALGVDVEDAVVGGVAGTWYRHRAGAADGSEADGVPTGALLYLHGGGYVGTSPSMYAFFVAELAKATGCAVFVADYRMAPEFPFPAGLHDAIAVLEGLLDDGIPADHLFLAGDSGGGGLATSLMWAAEAHHLPRLAGMLLFSPEVDLALDEPSITENADHDILPWNIPTAAYLQGIDPKADYVSAIHQHVDRWPPTYLAWGGDEMFRDAIRTLEQHLDEANVDTTAREVPGMFHVFPIVMPWADSSRRVLSDAGRLVHDVVGRPVPASVEADADAGDAEADDTEP